MIFFDVSVQLSRRGEAVLRPLEKINQIFSISIFRYNLIGFATLTRRGIILRFIYLQLKISRYATITQNFASFGSYLWPVSSKEIFSAMHNYASMTKFGNFKKSLKGVL